MSCYEYRPVNFGLRSANPLFFNALKSYLRLDLDVIPIDIATALGQPRATTVLHPSSPPLFPPEFIVTEADIKNLAGPDADVFSDYREWPPTQKSTQWKRDRSRPPTAEVLDLTLMEVAEQKESGESARLQSPTEKPMDIESKEPFGLTSPISTLARQDLQSSPFKGQELRLIRGVQEPTKRAPKRTNVPIPPQITGTQTPGKSILPELKVPAPKLAPEISSGTRRRFTRLAPRIPPYAIQSGVLSPDILPPSLLSPSVSTPASLAPIPSSISTFGPASFTPIPSFVQTPPATFPGISTPQPFETTHHEQLPFASAYGEQFLTFATPFESFHPQVGEPRGVGMLRGVRRRQAPTRQAYFGSRPQAG